MDEASLTEIINILRDDATGSSLHETQKGKHPANTTTDQDLALRAWQEEVSQYATLAEDHRMAMSIARAIHSDRQLVAAASDEEARATEDRRLAMRLAGNRQRQAAQAQARARARAQARAQSAPNQPAQAGDSRDNAPKRRVIGRVMGETAPAYYRYQPASSGHASAASHPDPPIVTLECLACTEATPITETIETPCSHNYCRTCATKLFDDSLRDESLFPPRCCRIAIPLHIVQHFLNSDLNKQFLEKSIEHNDPNRTYCSNSTCSRYLRAAGTLGGSNSRYCAQCLRWTCVRCKKGHNPGTDCPDDDEVLQLGRQVGWQRCSRCKNLVELTTGCNHITCRCHHEFCYSCGQVWKTCECPQWYENNLIDRAQNVLNRNPQQQQGPQALQQMAGRLRDVHQCDHDARWRRVGGPHRCEECRNFLPQFIMECTGCDLRTCARCRYNRL